MSEAVTTLKKNERLSLQMCLMSGNATLAILLELDLKVTSITCLANRLFLLFVFEEKKKIQVSSNLVWAFLEGNLSKIL